MTVFWCIIALICTGVGIACIAIPEEMIYMRNHAGFKECEPTEFHIRMERIKGITAIVIAIVIVICVFI